MTAQMTLQEWFLSQPLSMGELAAALGLHISTTSNLYRGRRWPDGKTALKLLEYSGGVVSVWDVAYYSAHRRPRKPKQVPPAPVPAKKPRQRKAA